MVSAHFDEQIAVFSLHLKQAKGEQLEAQSCGEKSQAERGSEGWKANVSGKVKDCSQVTRSSKQKENYCENY